MARFKSKEQWRIQNFIESLRKLYREANRLFSLAFAKGVQEERFQSLKVEYIGCFCGHSLESDLMALYFF